MEFNIRRWMDGWWMAFLGHSESLRQTKGRGILERGSQSPLDRHNTMSAQCSALGLRSMSN